MATIRVTERVSRPFSGSRVDREAGTISGVLLCGTSSANGRDYPADVLRRDYRAYEGRPVNCDHGREATVDRRLGWFTDVSPGPDGRPRGTLNLLKSHPMFDRVMEAAERNPALYGFSHVAMCDTRRGRDGREVVEAIRAIESIDLVAEPATVKSLFESTPKGNPVPVTIKQLAGWVARHSESKSAQVVAVKRLAEMDGMADVPVTGMDAAPPDDSGDPADGVKDAFKAAVMHIIEQAMSGEMDPKEALSKVKKLLASHGEVSGDSPTDTDTDGDGSGDTDTDGDGMPESKKKTTAGAGLVELREAHAACVAAGFANPTLDDLTLITAVPPEAREGVARRLARTAEGAGAEPVKSAGRRPGSGSAGPQKTTEGKAPATAAEFAASIRE